MLLSDLDMANTPRMSYDDTKAAAEMSNMDKDWWLGGTCA
jgi:hypothetical protein